MSTKIQNPILAGFNPDPSILCVGSDYYIATSTFEWYPGVQIHHSTDLVNWKVIERPLRTFEHLDMRGNMFSDGVWAPCLSYDKGVFYLIFTNVRSSQVYPFKDTPNYITTAPTINGPWSEPVYLNSSGFDPSLFHDDDGRKWFVNMEWDHRKQDEYQFSGILMQEYDVEAQTLVGEVYKISKGSDIGRVEGPHIYKKDGYYYLVTAEGGTSYQHAVTVFRSKSIYGPYEEHPHNPVVTAWEESWDYTKPIENYQKAIGSSYIKKAGHASWCQGPNGKWYMVHLGGRPVDIETNSCVLGRETSIQEMVWKEDGWCYLAHGTNKPAPFITIDEDVEKYIEKEKKYTFDSMTFMDDFQTLRIPYDEKYMSIHANPGCLRMTGRESIYSRFEQTLIARRQTDFGFEAETTMLFEPKCFQHMAGLIYRYNEDNQYYLYMTYDEEVDGYTLNVACVDDARYTLIATVPVTSTKVSLKLVVEREKGYFYYSEDEGKTYQAIGASIQTTNLSDEYARPMGFTGAFVGIAVQDLRGRSCYADFEHFNYKVTE